MVSRCGIYKVDVYYVVHALSTMHGTDLMTEDVIHVMTSL